MRLTELSTIPIKHICISLKVSETLLVEPVDFFWDFLFHISEWRTIGQE